MADTIYNIEIPGSYLEKTTPAERLVMISPNTNLIPDHSEVTKQIGQIGATNRFNVSFTKKYDNGNTVIEKITQSNGSSFEIYRGLIRLRPLNTSEPIIFKDEFDYPRNNKGYDQYGRIFYIVDADDGKNSVYIWYYSDMQIPFHIETITPIEYAEGVCF